MTKIRFEGQIFHFNAVRLRVTGTGNLDMELQSLDEIYINTLVPLAMTNLTNREPTQLANFNQQRALLRLSTDELDERFVISRIIIYIKPVATSFPQ